MTCIVYNSISQYQLCRSPPIINGLKHEPIETSFKSKLMRLYHSISLKFDVKCHVLDDESGYEIPKIKFNGTSNLNSLESSLDIPRFFQQNVKLIKTIGEGIRVCMMFAEFYF